MQDETPKTETTTTTADPALGRSAVAKLPAELREAVDKAIAGGATVDEITAGIWEAGENRSRSAAGRDATDTRGLLRTQREAVRVAKTWIEEFGERPQGELAQMLIEGLRAMACATMRHLARQKEPPSPEDIARLSLALKRLESTEELRARREQAAQKAAEAAKPQPKRRKGLSPEMAARIDEAVLGKARWPVGPDGSVLVDPLNPDESHLSPEKLAEMYPEIAPRVYRTSPTSILSLGPSPPAPKTHEPAAGEPERSTPEDPR